MRLHCLRAEGVRNLQDVNLKPHPSFNLIVGPNGSGKTSLLEIVNVLSLGRSFRTRELQPVITYQAPRLVCYAEIFSQDKTFPLGIEKRVGEPLSLQAKGINMLSLSDYMGHLAVQVITPDSFHLLTTGPEIRRRFVDLGVFHVKHLFLTQSLRFKKLLKQRNAALKQQAPPMLLKAIDEGFISAAEQVSSMRAEYLNEYIPVFHEVLSHFLPDLSFRCDYTQGWDSGAFNFAEALKKAMGQDLRYRSTTVGPHRADLKFSIEGFPAQQILSRGQQKLFVCALILAQSIYLSIKTKVKSVFLIDDLASELDKYNLARMVNWLLEKEHQIFVTSVEEEAWGELLQNNVAHKVFHVKHGRIQ